MSVLRYIYQKIEKACKPSLDEELQEIKKRKEIRQRKEFLFCCVPISGILTFGHVYEVMEWVEHKYGCDPAVFCDDGITRLIWKGLFHD